MRLIDVAREEEPRRLAGEPPLPLPPAAALGWLRRGGYARRFRVGGWAAVVGVLALIAGFLRLPQWGPLPFLVGWFVGALGSALTYSVRCPVCRTNVNRSRAALTISSIRRRQWLAQLEACPVCGDDGSATPESRQEWLAAGAPREPGYWSRRRVGLALLFTGLFIGGGILVAELTIRYWMRR